MLTLAFKLMNLFITKITTEKKNVRICFCNSSSFPIFQMHEPKKFKLQSYYKAKNKESSFRERTFKIQGQDSVI